MATLQDVLRPKKPVSHPEAAGYDRVHGNEMGLFERRQAPLMWMTPYYRPESMVVAPEARVLDRVPLRMGTKMRELRRDEMTLFGGRKYKEARPLQQEYTDRIRAMFEAEQREAEKNKKEFRKRRWWHRQADIELRDPVKALRYNNLLKHSLPIELVSARDIVTLQLTGCVVGDAHMSTVSAFMSQTYTLRRLTLQGNNLTAAGCKELVPGIRACKTLTEIDISLNPIGDDGCGAICTALLDSGLATDSKIYSVNMSTCRLTSSSGHHLSRLVRESKVVQSLCLWRNMLGELVPGDRSAALKMLDEMVLGNHALRILDLTANGLSDQDLAEHCRMLEANLRRNRLQDIEKKRIVERLFASRRELAERKATAVWENEKIEVKRLEKEVAADTARIQAYRRLEERTQTNESKRDEKFLSDIHRHTNGLEIHTIPRRTRLVLNGNFSVQPTTIARLKEYYDVSPVQNLDVFVNMPRRHADLLNYRRRIGDPYETKDPLAYDGHNIFKWEEGTYDPADHHRRRVAMQAYRDEEQRKRETARTVHFDKFKLNLHGTEEDFKNKKVQMGISVASGVNAKLKETHDDDVANGTGAYGEAKQAKLRGNLKDVTEETVIKKKVEKDPIVIIEKADANDAVRVKQTKDKDGNIRIEVVEGAHAMAPEEIANMQTIALAHHNNNGGGGAPSNEPVTVTMKTHIELNEAQQRERTAMRRKGEVDGTDADAPAPPEANAADNFRQNTNNSDSGPKSPTSPTTADGGPKTPRQLVDDANQSEAQRSAAMAHARLQARQQEVRRHIGRKSQVLMAAEADGGGADSSRQTTAPSTPRAPPKSPRRFTVIRRGSLASADGRDDATPISPTEESGGGGHPLGLATATARGSVASWVFAPAPNNGSFSSDPAAAGGAGGFASSQRRGTTYVPSDAPALLKSVRRGTLALGPFAAVTPPPEEGGSADEGGEGIAALAARAAGVDLAKSASAFEAFSPILLAATAANTEAFPTQEARLLACIGIVYEGWAAVRACAQVGSPTDAELKRLAEAEANAGALKGALVAALRPGGPLLPQQQQQGPIAFSAEEHTETVATFIDDLVKETDGAPHNVELLDALAAATATADNNSGGGDGVVVFDLPAIINERGLIGAAACDGSEVFLRRLLDLVGDRSEGMDATEIFCSCYYNSLSRIQLAQILFDACVGVVGGKGPHPAITAALAADPAATEEIAVVTQEFLEDIASDKKAVTRENRSGKLKLIQTLLEGSAAVFGAERAVSLEREAGDRHTVVSRALFEGDLPLLDLLFNTPSLKAMITDPNFVKSDNLSLLMVAVIGNHAAAVERLLRAFEGSSDGPMININLAVRADSSAAPATAIDLAITLGRDARIIEMLRAKGASIVGDEVATSTVANGKMIVNVTKK